MDPRKKLLQPLQKIKEIIEARHLSNEEKSDSHGFYLHKTQLEAEFSVLINPQKNKYYGLVHYPKEDGPRSGKKIILGQGIDTVVREGIDLETQVPVAIKVYPLYPKKNAPGIFSDFTVKTELKRWDVLQTINRKLPGIFVEFYEYFSAGDKSSLKNPQNKLVYVITKKYNNKLRDLVDSKRHDDELKNILIELFVKLKKLLNLGFLFGDVTIDNILLDDNRKPTLCDPSSLTKEINEQSLHYFYLNALNLFKRILRNLMPPPRGVLNHEAWEGLLLGVSNFLHRFVRENYSEENISKDIHRLFNSIPRPIQEFKVDESFVYSNAKWYLQFQQKASDRKVDDDEDQLHEDEAFHYRRLE